MIWPLINRFLSFPRGVDRLLTPSKAVRGLRMREGHVLQDSFLACV